MKPQGMESEYVNRSGCKSQPAKHLPGYLCQYQQLIDTFTGTGTSEGIVNWKSRLTLSGFIDFHEFWIRQHSSMQIQQGKVQAMVGISACRDPGNSYLYAESLPDTWRLGLVSQVLEDRIIYIIGLFSKEGPMALCLKSVLINLWICKMNYLCFPFFDLYQTSHHNIQAAYVKYMLLGKPHTCHRLSTFKIHFEGST